MSQAHFNWKAPQPSVFRDASGMLTIAEATSRPHGALRYQCPATGSLVLITDEATLGELSGRFGRIRCADCGEVHLLTRPADAAAVR